MKIHTTLSFTSALVYCGKYVITFSVDCIFGVAKDDHKNWKATYQLHFELHLK